MINVRPVTLAELPICAEKGQAFYKEGNLPGSLIPEVFVKTWTALFGAGLAHMYVLEIDGEIQGAIGGVVVPDLNDGVLMGNEAFWFVVPEARGQGLRLLDAFEKSVEKAGAKRIGMIHLLNLMPDVLAKLYIRKGYKAIETHYIKELA